MKCMMFLLALLAAGPRLAAQDFMVDEALRKDFTAYRELRRGLIELRQETDQLETAMVTNRGTMEDFRRINVEHTQLLDKVYEVVPALAEEYRKLVEASEAVLGESQQLNAEAKELACLAYQVFQQASAVHCAAAALPGQLRQLNTAIEIGKALTAAVWFGIGFAAGGAAATTTTTTSTLKGGSFNPWGTSFNPWGGGGGGAIFTKTVVTSAASSSWASAALFAMPFAAMAGTHQSGCVGAACVPVVACQPCIEKEKKCNGSPACIEQVKKNCKDCEGKNTPLVPVPETTKGVMP